MPFFLNPTTLVISIFYHDIITAAIFFRINSSTIIIVFIFFCCRMTKRLEEQRGSTSTETLTLMVELCPFLDEMALTWLDCLHLSEIMNFMRDPFRVLHDILTCRTPFLGPSRPGKCLGRCSKFETFATVTTFAMGSTFAAGPTP